MNREIKFRAWDSIAGKMWEDVYFDGGHIYTIGPDGENASTMPRWDDNALMQFTGLKDKNGKEIFEGDVVKRTVDMANYSEAGGTEEKLFEIKWYGIELLPFSETSTHMEEFEVIGNTFENKDLLL